MLTGGFRPYPVQVSPKGDIAVVGNQGGGAGDIDTINVIDMKAKVPRIVHTIDVGQIVEGLAFSDDGSHLAVTAQDGSNRPTSNPFHNAKGLLVVFKVDGTTLTKVADLRTAVWNQGVAWSRDGKTLKATGEIKTKGGPEGIRTAEK